MRIATTRDETVWQCDAGCGELTATPNAFTLPPGWWSAVIQRRTGIDENGHGNKLKRGSIDACSKECLLDAITYQNQSLIDYVEEART